MTAMSLAENGLPVNEVLTAMFPSRERAKQVSAAINRSGIPCKQQGPRVWVETDHIHNICHDKIQAAMILMQMGFKCEA